MQKYDLIIPIGTTCKNTHNLRALKRQYESLPFDWILTLDLDQIHKALATKFSDFLKKENMEYKCKESEQTDIYFDRATDIGFWHDFPHNVPLEQSFDTIRKKYDRRIQRLFEEINRSKDILFCRVNTIRPESGWSVEEMIYPKSVIDDAKLDAQFKKIQDLYPDKNISLLEVSVFNTPHNYVKRVIRPNFTRVEVFSDIKYEWEGDPEVFKEILKDYKLKNTVILRNEFNSLLFKCRKFGIKVGAKLGIEKYKQSKQQLKNRFSR